MLDRVRFKSVEVLLPMHEEITLNCIGTAEGLERLTIGFGFGQLKNLTHLELLCLWSISEESLLHICPSLHR